MVTTVTGESWYLLLNFFTVSGQGALHFHFSEALQIQELVLSLCHHWCWDPPGPPSALVPHG